MRNKLRNLSDDMNTFKVITMLNSIMLCALLIWSFVKPDVRANAPSAPAGNVATNLSISGSNTATNRPNSGNGAATNRANSGNEAATRRGYYTASEYARLTGISLETVYRHANAGAIKGAELVGGRWRIPLLDK